MRFFRVAGLLALASSAYAFPADVMEQLEEEFGSEQFLEARADPSTANDAQAIFEPIPLFNEKLQHIDVSDHGPNPFKAPGPKDLRGPCPGLNAFANHGFLPRNGFATTAQFLEVTQNVVGMGIGLASFLAVLGSSIDGDGMGWSIGGTPPKNVGGGNGISASHNKYESDASPLRPDLYESGNDYKVRIQQFKTLSSLIPAGNKPNIDIVTLTKFRNKRFNRQIAHNPFFFNGPFTGVLVQPAAYTFIYRFMANHSEHNPHGHLSRSNFMDWFSIVKKNGEYKWVPGHERIPYHWYRRSPVYPYDQSYFFADLGNAAKIYPHFANVGGNTGKVNTFTGVDVKNLTGGAFNSQNLLKGNNLACLGFQFAAQGKPDVTNSATDKFQKLLTKQVAKLGCKTLVKSNNQQLEQFPGYTRSQNGDTG